MISDEELDVIEKTISDSDRAYERKFTPFVCGNSIENITVKKLIKAYRELKKELEELKTHIHNLKWEE